MMMQKQPNAAEVQEELMAKETGISVCRQSIAQFVCNRTSGKLQALFYCYTVMAELAAVLAKDDENRKLSGQLLKIHRPLQLLTLVIPLLVQALNMG